MNQADRQDFEDMKVDIRHIKDDLHLLMNNHLVHLQRSVDEAGDKAEQAWGMASDAERHAKRTEKFVIAGIAFIGLIIAIIECVGG